MQCFRGASKGETNTQAKMNRSNNKDHSEGQDQGSDDLAIRESGFALSHQNTELNKRIGESDSRLQENQQRIQKIIAGALDTIITMDLAGIITGWNTQAERLFGWKSSEAIGQRHHSQAES